MNCKLAPLRTTILIMVVMLIGASLQAANAESIPSWIKNNAKWWADGTIGDKDFIQGIQYMVNKNIIDIPKTDQGQKSSQDIPSWIKNNAKWWADGTISDADFVQGIKFLIKSGIITIEQEVPTKQAQVTSNDSSLQRCKDMETERERYECEKALRAAETTSDFKQKSKAYVVGPVTFYYPGAKVEKSGSTDILNLKFLVENTGSKDNVALYCTGPAACNYDISDGQTTYKYAANDFTSGQIVLRPGMSKELNIMFGPAIGYGSYVSFKYDHLRQYTFNVKESWGTASIPLELK